MNTTETEADEDFLEEVTTAVRMMTFVDPVEV